MFNVLLEILAMVYTNKQYNSAYNCSENALIVFAAYFLLLNTFVPISLIVSLEFVKVVQGYFMEKDKEMYSPENNRHMKVFSTSINEELG